MFLFKMKSGYYYLYYNDETGKRNKLSCRTKSKSQALKFLSEFNGDKRKSVTTIPITIKDLRTEILKYCVSNFRKTTTQIYKRVFNDMLRIFNNRPVRLISVRDIENYKSIRSSKVSPGMVNIDLSTMKAIFNIAIRFDWISENPVNRVKKLSIPEKERLCFTQSEFNLIINHIDNAVIKNIVLFAFFTGCRLNEICNVQIRDINLVEKILTIRNKPDFKTKSGRVRVIPIDKDLYELLSPIFKKDNIINYINPELYLFRNSKGFKYNKNFVSMKFKEALRAAKLPDRFHFHCLRHTRISIWVKQGIPLPIIMKLAGHRQSETTQNYIHITIEDLKNALNNLYINL